MVQQIISSSKTNIETLYQRISYFPDYQLMTSIWFPHTTLMTNDDFLMEIELLLHRVLDTGSNKILLNCERFDFFISPSNVSSYLSKHGFELEKMNVEKVALIPPSNNLIKISLEQAIDSLQPVGNFGYHSFESLSEAIHWLKNKA